MRNDPLRFFLKRQEGKSLRLRKKARLLAIACLVLGVMALVLGALMLVTGAVAVGVLAMAFGAYCALCLFVLASGRFSWACSGFLYGLFAVMFSAIKFDQYIDIYECYTFATLGLTVTVTGILLSDDHKHPIILMILNLIAVAILYVVDLLPTQGGQVTALDIQSLATAAIMLVASGIFASVAVKGQGDLMDSVERSAAERDSRVAETARVVEEARASVQDTSTRISEATDRTATMIHELQGTLVAVNEGMASLNGALKETADANGMAVSKQEEVRKALEAYSTQVSSASASVEEMALSVKSIGDSALNKQEAVKKLVTMASDNEGKLGEVKKAVDAILLKAAKMDEMNALIGDVADRTNLLGMNASIEAAHAGSAGRGFAVVAGQIRSLSEETGKNSRLIADILKDTKQGIDITARVNLTAAESFRVISAEIRDVSAMIEELLMSLKEISVGSTELMRSVESVAGLTSSTHEAVDASLAGIGRSSESVLAVLGMARSIEGEAAAMAKVFREIAAESEKVRSLGSENVARVATLKEKLSVLAD